MSCPFGSKSVSLLKISCPFGFSRCPFGAARCPFGAARCPFGRSAVSHRGCTARERRPFFDKMSLLSPDDPSACEVRESTGAHSIIGHLTGRVAVHGDYSRSFDFVQLRFCPRALHTVCDGARDARSRP